MSTLSEKLDALTKTVLSGGRSLDEALVALERWLERNVDQIGEDERDEFTDTLHDKSSNDSRSLITSVLKLHMTRLLYRYDVRQHEAQPAPPANDQSAYAQARKEFTQALRQSEEGVNEARIDIAIANAHQLLADPAANVRWLDAALARLPGLASADLVAMAEDIPPMPPPRLNVFQRIGLKLMGFNFDRLAEDNREALAAIGQMQADQIITLAHLVGASFEAVHRRQRARRAYRIAAHLIVRHEGMRGQDAEQLLEIAEAIWHDEIEAAHILARQAQLLCEEAGDAPGLARAEIVLKQ